MEIIVKFERIYVEITTICGLSCSFCPSANENATMNLEQFRQIIYKIKDYTNQIALHVMGDPLVLSDIGKYLDIAYENALAVEITTSGFYSKNLHQLLHPAIRQINFSLNSYNKNSTTKTLDEYLAPLVDFIDKKQKYNSDIYINFRLWNIDDENDDYNERVFEFFRDFYEIDGSHIEARKNIRLDKKVLIHFDRYFQWPSLESNHYSDGYCHGLSKQLAILVDGRVVPCCLDYGGVIELGSLVKENLDKILESQKSVDILEGFKNSKAIEELCQKCSYKDRFKRS